MKFSYRKLLLVILIVFFLMPVKIVYAAATLDPEFNPNCWEKKPCDDKRAELSGGAAQTSEGWLDGAGDCKKKGWGMCLPVGVTKAEVSFGGNAKFSDIGVYITTIYNYSLTIIGILAVVMIIIGGIQWITSAGNQEVKDKAKKRITGAIIGLFIAYMSYTILNTINPATINLRLPQVYMVREQILGSMWCRDQKPEVLFAFAADGQHQSDKLTATGKETFNLPYPFGKTSDQDTTFWCGQRFYVKGASSNTTCMGDRCGKGTVCSNINPVDKNNPYICRAGSIAGEITGGFSTSNNPLEYVGVLDKWNSVGNSIEVYLACNDGTPNGKIEELSVNSNVQYSDQAQTKMGYTISVDPADLQKAIDACGGATKVRGALMRMDFDLNASLYHEIHYIGKDGVDVYAKGKVILCYEMPYAYPAWFKDSLFIPLTSLQTGVQINFPSPKPMNNLEAACSVFLQTYKDNFLPGFPPAGFSG